MCGRLLVDQSELGRSGSGSGSGSGSDSDSGKRFKWTIVHGRQVEQDKQCLARSVVGYIRWAGRAAPWAWRSRSGAGWAFTTTAVLRVGVGLFAHDEGW